MYILLAVTFLVSLEFCFPDSNGLPKWSYDEQGHWPQLCVEGKRQSPVNIESDRAVQDASGDVIRAPLTFRRYSDVLLKGLNNGHTVKFTVEGDTELRPVLSGGPLLLTYVLDQFHFHWLGEHAIDQIKYPLEIHFVHHRRDLTLDEAKYKKDGIVVLAVLCKLSLSQNDDWALQEVVKRVPELVNASSETPTEKLDLLQVLSPERDSYYTYEGSLTTPGCLEIVTWIVLDTPIRITDQQYKAFNKVRIEGDSNFRSLQPLNRRVVYRTPLKSSSGVAVRPSGVVAGVVTAVAGTLVAASGAAAAAAALVKTTVDAALAIKRRVFGVDVRG